MDPIYIQVNQTRVSEFTQKTSDNLSSTRSKEAKNKAEKAGEVDKSAMSTDSSAMSEDMLGNMDPDDYGGRGAKQFAQMWREQMEEVEQEKEEESEEGGGDQQDAEPEDQTAPNKEESEVEGLPSDDPSEVEGTHLTPPTPTAPEVAAETAKAPTPEPARAAERPPAEPAAPAAAKERAPVTPPTSAGQAQAQANEKFSASKATPAATVGPEPAGKKSSLGSLLDFSSGYLIAEEAHWDPEAAEEALPEEAHTAEATLPEEISILLERLVSGDSSQPGFRKLHGLLARFGRRVLQQCIEAHARVYLLPPGEPLLAHPQLAHCGDNDLQGAAYLPDQRLCLVEDDCVSQAPHGFHPVFYYFAHLWDHAMGGEGFASSKSAAVKASYQVCLEGGHRFGDLMSSHSPAHYFAQAVESYLSENDCFEPLWTRQDLYDFDRSIYDYIEYLLR